MLAYDKRDISERNDKNKTNASKECDICHCSYFLDKSFNYEPYFCNGKNRSFILFFSLYKR